MIEYRMSYFTTRPGSQSESGSYAWFMGSEREFDEGYILRSFLDLLKFNELGIGDRHAFGLEQ